MHKRVISLGLPVMMGMGVLIAPAQAAGFPFLQPYVSDYKMGFTDGSKRVTQPLYETFSKEKEVLVVTKNGKKGALHAKTGAEIIPAVP